MAPPAGLRGTSAEMATEAEVNAGEKGHVLKSGEDQGSRSWGTKEIPEPALWWRGEEANRTTGETPEPDGADGVLAQVGK